MKLTQSPRKNSGKLQLFYLPDVAHSSFDNVAFYDRTHVIFVQDMGDGLHTAINALDSAFLFDVNADYSHGAQPVKVIAEGRDPSATIDSALGALGRRVPERGRQRDHRHSRVERRPDGRRSSRRAPNPRPFSHGWRLFYTHQHGDNVTSEIVPAG